ncbi:RagB/SusD family nutrient uptake outer membrane protein [Winogradskyella echinorum]|uniref:RagB/SusD family nutrient uptake outer membrane protein n=1 Tax=Winogradskyella echinorum TaxID=538189 RepID=A0ABR6Y2T5_9FLAO|nr:RagB/SusD family nutrient uptake outer membrane protein [Winogradskyella echinorum]MBC3846543.1 RagB/SusD family nutrient uptake outer membrane protein [Winogradskyella echinorum]MBC5750891.1 RagB/SusD family nutrient uptake outer membrane protein [Winogradskyella echinorum]
MMKKVYILIVLIATIFVSCDDYLVLENPNAIDSTQFFQDEDDVSAAVTGVYAELRRYPELYNIYLSEVRSNNINFNISNAQRDAVDISRFNVSQVMVTVEDAWQYGYVVIARANKVLEVLDELNLPNQEFNTKSRGEARFLRAYAHYNLVRTFGRIPIVDETLSPEEGVSIGQSETEEVYAFIEEDLNIAIDNLADSYPGEEGRATKRAAKALLAELYLTWASYPVQDLSKLDASIALFEELIPTLNWASNFEDLFKVENDNTYSLFEVQYVSGTAGIGATFPSQFLSSNFLQFPFNGGVPQIRPSQDLIDSFDQENDLRFNASVDTVYTNNFFLQQQDNYIKKWFETDEVPNLLSRSDWPHNYPIIRPASIYLMHAEALNLKNGGPTTQAIQSLNMTRSRAGLTNANPVNAQEFNELLKSEYRYEFVGEGQYWHYLVRSEQAVDVMNDFFTMINESITINENKLVYPIPFSQMQIREGLYTQNPGY